MSEAITKWMVMAHRTAQSILGPANAPCKRDGKVIQFDTFGAAQAYKDELTRGLETANIFYTVEPYDPQFDN